MCQVKEKPAQTILLAALSAFGSLMVTGILIFILLQILERMETPQPFPRLGCNAGVISHLGIAVTLCDFVILAA